MKKNMVDSKMIRPLCHFDCDYQSKAFTQRKPKDIHRSIETIITDCGDPDNFQAIVKLEYTSQFHFLLCCFREFSFIHGQIFFIYKILLLNERSLISHYFRALKRYFHTFFTTVNVDKMVLL